MDLVEEQDGAHVALTQAGLGTGHELAHVLHAGVDSRQLGELLGGDACDQAGHRRLARARRAPQDHRREAIRFDQLAKRPSGAQQVVLPDDVVQTRGT